MSGFLAALPSKPRSSNCLGNKHRDAHIGNTLTVIRHQSQIPRITGDPLPDYINVPNGMVDWKTGVLREHSPKYLSTVQLPVEHDTDADCPAFNTFITDVSPADCYQPCNGGPGFIWELPGVGEKLSARAMRVLRRRGIDVPAGPDAQGSAR